MVFRDQFLFVVCRTVSSILQIYKLRNLVDVLIIPIVNICIVLRLQSFSSIQIYDVLYVWGNVWYKFSNEGQKPHWTWSERAALHVKRKITSYDYDLSSAALYKRVARITLNIYHNELREHDLYELVPLNPHN